MSYSSAEATVVASAISRQAIFDAKLEVTAYELRHANPSRAVGEQSPSSRGEQSPESSEQTGGLLLSAFAEFGLEKLVGRRKAFVAVSSRALLGGLPLPVPAPRVVLQVKDSTIAPNLIGAVRGWKDRGFEVALDQFELSQHSSTLLDFVDYVKVDVSRRSERELREVLDFLTRYFAEPIATGISTNEQLRFCASLGFTGFQGNFLFQRQHLQRAELPSSAVVVSQVLALVQNPDVDFAQIEATVKRDMSLSVAVLKFLNAAAFGFRREVSSISQAVSLLGLTEFTKWLLLVFLAARKDKPSELLLTALVRARTCENVARTRAMANPAQAFTVGLLSLLDALLEQPMETVLEELPLTPQVRSAILDFDGVEGEILELVITREQAMPELDEQDQQQLTRAWLEALSWAESIRQAS